MKLTEINNQSKTGTYAGVRFSKKTNDAIKKFIKDNNIPNPVNSSKLHTTLLYSRKYLPNYEPKGKLETPMKGIPTGFDVWETQPDENGKTSNCLVLKYNCPKLYQRHHKLMNQHGATFDYDEYRCHVTLSYNIGNLKVDKLPKFEDDIEIVEEYGEDLDLSWAKNNTDK